jgi:nitronate monooxygenase
MAGAPALLLPAVAVAQRGGVVRPGRDDPGHGQAFLPVIVYRDALLAAGPEDTVLTEAFSVDGPSSQHRVLRSALAAASAFDGEVVGELHVLGGRRQVRRFSADNPSDNATGRVDAMALYAGESVGAVRRVQPAGKIVAELAAEADELLRRLATG